MILAMKEIVGVIAGVLVVFASIVYMRTKSRQSLFFMIAALLLLLAVIILAGTHVLL